LINKRLNARENGGLNDLGFISIFTGLLEKLPENIMKEKFLEDLNRYTREIENGKGDILSQELVERFLNIIDEFENNIDKIKQKFILF